MTKSLYLALAASVAATALATGFQSNKGQATQSRKSNLSVNLAGSKKVNIDLPLGEVHLTTGSGSQVKVNAVRSFRGPATDAAKRWLNDSVLRVEQKNGAVVVEDLPFGKRDSRINGNFNPRLELEVSIPEGLDVTLNVSAGTVDGGGHYRSLNGSVSAGSLKLKKLDCDRDFNLQVSAGEVNTELASVPSKDSHVQTSVGSLILQLPRNANADVTAQTDIGKIDGLPKGKKKSGDDIEIGDERRARFGKGGVGLHLQVSTGSIRVGSPDEAEAMIFQEPVSVATEIDEAVYPQAQIDHMTAADKKEMEKAIKEAMLEVQKAMKEVRTSTASGHIHEEVQREIEQAMKEARTEAAQAMKEAREEIRRAMAESKGEFDGDELSKSIEAMVKSALETAMAATDQAMKASDLGLKQAEKAMKKAQQKASSKAAKVKA